MRRGPFVVRARRVQPMWPARKHGPCIERAFFRLRAYSPLATYTASRRHPVRGRFCGATGAREGRRRASGKPRVTSSKTISRTRYKSRPARSPSARRARRNNNIHTYNIVIQYHRRRTREAATIFISFRTAVVNHAGPNKRYLTTGEKRKKGARNRERRRTRCIILFVVNNFRQNRLRVRPRGGSSRGREKKCKHDADRARPNDSFSRRRRRRRRGDRAASATSWRRRRRRRAIYARVFGSSALAIRRAARLIVFGKRVAGWISAEEIPYSSSDLRRTEHSPRSGGPTNFFDRSGVPLLLFEQ